MKAVQKRILWAILIGLLVGTFWIESRRGNQYKIGMSVADVRLQCGSKYPLQKFAVGWDDHSPTKEERNKAIPYYIYDDQSGIILYFNDYQILVKKTKIKYFGINLSKLIDSFR